MGHALFRPPPVSCSYTAADVMAAAAQSLLNGTEDPSATAPAQPSTDLLMACFPPVSTTPPVKHFPASTESLLERMLDEILSSQPVPSPSSPAIPDITHTPSAEDPNYTTLFAKFSVLLDRGLARTALEITIDMKADIRELGARIEHIETKPDTTIFHTNQNTVCLEILQQLDQVLAKIKDLKNKSRRYNLRLQGLPE